MLETCLDVFGDRKICLARELTKKHEEFIRGHISEVIEIVDELKGEMVIVMEGSKEEAIQLEIFPPLYEHINAYISQGYSTNEAIKKVAKERGVSKNQIYKEYHTN